DPIDQGRESTPVNPRLTNMRQLRHAILMLLGSLAISTGTSGVLALAADEPPTDWIDATTGHRILRLSQDPGSSSLYFHQNTYTPEGDKLIFNTRKGIASVDLTMLG